MEWKAWRWSWLACLLWPVLVQAWWERDRGDLRGVDSVEVVFDGVQREWARYGFDESALRQEIARRLSQAGMDVVGPAAASHEPPTARLVIRIRRNVTQYRWDSFAVIGRVQRRITDTAQPGPQIWELVWRDWRIGAVEAFNTRQLHDRVLEVVDDLVADYRAQRGW